MKKFTQKLTIPCYNTDASWRLKPASFMNLAQEAAGQHAVHLGFGYDDLIVSNTAWILSRVHIEFIDAPKWREDITLTTWHKGLNRLFFLRDFILTDAQGRVVNFENTIIIMGIRSMITMILMGMGVKIAPLTSIILLSLDMMWVMTKEDNLQKLLD